MRARTAFLVGLGASLAAVAVAAAVKGVQNAGNDVQVTSQSANGYTVSLAILPKTARVGRDIVFIVRVTKDGMPVPNAQVTLRSPKSSTGVEVVRGVLTTDYKGEAVYVTTSYNPATVTVTASYTCPCGQTMVDSGYAVWNV